MLKPPDGVDRVKKVRISLNLNATQNITDQFDRSSKNAATLVLGSIAVAALVALAPAARSVAVGKGPEALLFDGRTIWVASQFSDTVSAIDPDNDRVIRTIKVGERPVALASDGTALPGPKKQSHSCPEARAA